jgi:hypothetical protein
MRNAAPEPAASLRRVRLPDAFKSANRHARACRNPASAISARNSAARVAMRSLRPAAVLVCLFRSPPEPPFFHPGRAT